MDIRHTQNLTVINTARENGVFILSLPPHCTHKLQPLDVAFMKPLATYYTQMVECWLKQHNGRCVTVFQLANLFGNAYLKLATAQTAANGLRKTGIYPLNCNIFEDHEFAPSSVTDQVQPGTDASDQIFDDIFTPVNATQEIPDEVQRLTGIQEP